MGHFAQVKPLGSKKPFRKKLLKSNKDQVSTWMRNKRGKTVKVGKKLAAHIDRQQTNCRVIHNCHFPPNIHARNYERVNKTSDLKIKTDTNTMERNNITRSRAHSMEVLFTTNN